MPEASALHWHEYVTPEELASALSVQIATHLREAISEHGSATLAVSGGRTPRLLFEALSHSAIDWNNVTVTLVDDRFVAPDVDRSNERLARSNLLQNEARSARFVPLYHAGVSVEDAAEMAAADISKLPKPLDVVVLGMGPDGHTASFFPDAGNIEALIKNSGNRAVLPVLSESAVEPRLTLSMQMLGSARHVILHIESQERRTIFEDAIAGNELPIARFFEQTKTIPQIYWAP